MTERLAEWDHDQFKKIIVKVANMEIAYKAIAFYLDRQVSPSYRPLVTSGSELIIQPKLLPDLLAALTPRLDHGRVVKILQTEDHLPLVKPYLVGTQKLNITVVNEAYNDLLIEEEDHVTLRSSLETYDQYDAIKLARRLEKHELLEFRRIAALLYRVSRRWRSLVQIPLHCFKLIASASGVGCWTRAMERCEEGLSLTPSSTTCTRNHLLSPKPTDYGVMPSRLLLQARILQSQKSSLGTLFLLETRMLSQLFSMFVSNLFDRTLLKRW
jgi:hypothetical protein